MTKLQEQSFDIETIDRMIDKHQGTPDSLIQVLLDIQGEYRWLPDSRSWWHGHRVVPGRQ